MSAASSRPRILLVEDEFVLARFVRRALNERGYDCSVVNSAAVAIRKLESESFDVVVSDVRLGRESGGAVLEHARERMPGARRILMSGAAAEPAERTLAHAFLYKPFTLAELFEAIEGDEGVDPPQPE